jgi:hypothetical protein
MENTSNETVEQTVAAPEQATETAPAVEQPNEIDYKAELSAAKNHNRSGYEMRKGKDVQENTAETGIDTQQAIDEAANRAALAAVKAFKEQSAEGTVSELLNGITNPDERALVEHHYRNTIRTSGMDRSAIANDIQSARAIANAGRILKENSELKVAVQNRTGLASTPAGASQPVITPTNSEWSKEQLDYFAKKGIDPQKVKANMNKV